LGDNDTITSARGTYEFLAPECCDPDRQSFSGKAADIWALGVTLYAMIFNELPFQAEGISIFKAIQKT
jgi:serine/threonine protein kinase